MNTNYNKISKGLFQFFVFYSSPILQVEHQPALIFESALILATSQFNYSRMSSNITLKTLFARNHKVNEHILLSSSNPTYGSYQEDLDNNLLFILKKYAHLDRKKVSDLLEELDNNRQLAMQILDAEESHCNSNIEEHRNSIRQSTLTLQEENTIFKRAYLSLYKNRQAVLKELDEVRKKFQSERAENEKLKQLNKYLMQCEMNRGLNGEDFTPVC